MKLSPPGKHQDVPCAVWQCWVLAPVARHSVKEGRGPSNCDFSTPPILSYLPGIRPVIYVNLNSCR
eukprot:scaffold5506_cov42-Prasinocladus_malaysianus.AAC.1